MEATPRSRSPWSKIRQDPSFPTVPRKPGLDGLRALAVVAVIVYHLNSSWLPGGFFGVDVFFVISGYLITSLLVSEFGRLGRIDLKRFWLARARRLLPSVVVLLTAVIVASCFIARDALPALRTDVLFSLLYVLNWWLVVHKVSYFQSIGRPPLLLHLWSLAVEEQFYLVWPTALFFLLRRVNLRAVLLLALVGAAASSAWMAVLYHPGLDPSRAYFGTDSHAQGLLIGCALAIMVPPWATRSQVARPARAVLNGFTLAALAGLGVMFATLGENSPFAYPWGFLLVDVCAAVLIVVVVHPAAALGPIAGMRPIRWVGTRSYALYLWHWPIIQLTRPDQDVSFSGWPVLVLRIGLMVIAAELSYRLVEIPFKRPELWAGWWSWIRTGPVGQVSAGLTTAAVGGVAALLLLVPGNVTPIAALAIGSTPAARAALSPHHALTSATPSTSIPGPDPATTGPSTAPSGSTSTSVAPGTSTTPPTLPTNGGTVLPTIPNVPGGSTSTTVVGTSTTGPTTTVPGSSTTAEGATAATGDSTTTAPPAPTTTLPANSPAAILASKEPILAIGDSVMVASNAALTAEFGNNIVVDAQVGRQVSDGIARLQAYKASGQLATFKTVVIDLGTNGPLTTDLFNQLVAVLQGVPHVVFYNTYDPRAWESTTNDTLAQCVPQHPNMVELNWAAVAPGPGVLYPDDIHPTLAGAADYTSLLNAALSSPTG